jgi:membrane-bound lytic murein transglycosylase D
MIRLFFAFLCLFIGVFAHAQIAEKETQIFTENPELETVVPEEVNKVYHLSEFEIRKRLKQISSTIPLNYSPEVGSYIRTYAVRKRARTEGMLGRMSQYFHIIDNGIASSGLPYELRNLSVLESGLNPSAVSSANAVGLWQFIYTTGRQYGLRIDGTVDERREPVKSTKSALKFLENLYNTFGDWNLAMAAYNCGPARVNAAIKRSHSTSWWRVKHYLPQETRNYIPAFAAACYITNFYHLHDLRPEFPQEIAQNGVATKVYESISFYKISEITGVPYSLVKELNPAYKKDFVPGSTEGSFVILPSDAAKILAYSIPQSPMQVVAMAADILSNESKSEIKNEVNSTSASTYVVKTGDNLHSVSRLFACSVEDLVRWNNLSKKSINIGQRLLVYLPMENKVISTPNAEEVIPSPNSNAVFVSEETIERTPVAKKSNRKNVSNKYHKVKSGETLSEIAEKYKGVTTSELVRENNLSSKRIIRPGQRLRIPN